MKAEWQVKTLGEVCKTSSGGTPLKSKREYYADGNIPWLMSGEVSQGEIHHSQTFISQKGLENSSAKLFPINTVLVAMYGATAGQVGILKFEAATNQAVCGIFPTKEFLPEFLYYQFLSKKEELIGQATGNAQPNISQAKIRNTEVGIPPLPEQKRIVSILDEAFEGIAKAKANAEHNARITKELFAKSYTSIFNSCLHGNEKLIRVQDLAKSSKGSMRTGPFGSQLLHSEFVDDGIAVLGIDNVVSNEFGWSRRRYITEEKYKALSRYKVYPGDVLISIMGTCGRCAIVPEGIETAINTKHLCCITLDQKKCIPSFLHGYFLYHNQARDYLSEQTKGSIMDGLNMGIIQELPVVLPTLEIQQVISGKIEVLRDEMNRLEAIYRQKIAALDELKKALLHKAFAGEL